MDDTQGEGAAGATGAARARPPVDLGLVGYSGYQEIGRGGFSVVYKAIQTDFDRTVAIKVISGTADDQTLMRFERECRTMGTLSDHPNIVTVFGNGRTEKGDLYIVMEFLGKGSLADRLAEGPLPWVEVVDVGVRISEALQAAHDGGVLHRDVKPENIFVSNYGEAKLGDFGIARLEGGASTRSGVITASVAHAAPEILDGKRPNEASDVYSLGSTLFTLLAGSPAFTSATDESIVPMLARIAIDPVPDLRPRGVPSVVCDVLEASMAKKLEHRIPTATEYARRLLEAKEHALRDPYGATLPVVPILPLGGVQGSWPPPTAQQGTAQAGTGEWTNTGVPHGHAVPTGSVAPVGAPSYTGGIAPGNATGNLAGNVTGSTTGSVYPGYASGTGPVPAATKGGGAKVAVIVVLAIAVLGVFGALGVAVTSGNTASTTPAIPVTSLPVTVSSPTVTAANGGGPLMNDLILGDCFNHPSLSAVIDGTAQSDVAVTSVGCDLGHDMQIVAQKVVTAGRTEVYPADLAQVAEELCRSGFEEFVGASFDIMSTLYGAITVYPDEVQWASGKRGVVCATYKKDGKKMTATLQGAG